jgi:hypothetical protein
MVMPKGVGGKVQTYLRNISKLCFTRLGNKRGSSVPPVYTIDRGSRTRGQYHHTVHHRKLDGTIDNDCNHHYCVDAKRTSVIIITRQCLPVNRDHKSAVEYDGNNKNIIGDHATLTHSLLDIRIMSRGRDLGGSVLLNA